MTLISEDVRGSQTVQFGSSLLGESEPTDVPRWYAIHTRAKHEKRVAEELQNAGIQVFVPVVREVHRWSDRSKVVEIPLFTCYAFVRGVLASELQSTVVRQPGVLRWICCQGRPSPIPEEEIQAIQAVMQSGVPVEPHCFVKSGERVRIRGGSLDGVEGIVIRHEEGRKLVISVDAVGRSIAISLSNYELERVLQA